MTAVARASVAQGRKHQPADTYDGPELPLTDAEVEELFDARGTPEKGRLRIQSIRKNLPGRATRTSKLAGKVRMASKKMQFALEAEAFHTEFVALVEWDHDPEVHEIFPQPCERLVIEYRNAKGRRIKTPITPDAFLITATRFIYVECKTAADLEKLGRDHPTRYVLGADGRWHSPPAEAAAAELGCEFHIRSADDNNYALFDNLGLLRDFLIGTPKAVPSEAKELLKRRLDGQSYLSAWDLIHVEPRVSADHLYALLVSGEIYFPLADLRLTEQERAYFFRSEADWRAHQLFLSTFRPDRRVPQLRDDIRPGDVFLWDGVSYSVINPGSDGLTARSEGAGKGLIELSYEELRRLMVKGKISMSLTAVASDRREVEAILQRASKADLLEATWRHEILCGRPRKENPLKERSYRTVCYWKRAFKDAEERWGSGFVGLLADRHGNRIDKVSPDTKALAIKVIEEEWETHRQKSRSVCHGSYLNQAEKMGLDTLSLQTFCKMISERAGHAQQVTRDGEKGAYELEEQFLQLEQTTARHGTHSWHIGHIDHTPLPLKFLLSDYADFADTVWLTVLSGGFDRKVRGFYLSFDEPSYRSCMMVIRDCVRRHGRMFQLVVSDGGSEFQSEYYESLLAWMGCHKRERLKGKPRYGSVCERLFRTQQTQFVSNLLGATGIVEQHFRAISPEVAPEKHAVWILDAFDTKFEEYTETIFHKAYHTGLDMTPDEAEARSLRSHGRRDFILRPYDDQFIAMTCPEIHRGDALVTPRGIKIKYLWFNDRALQQPGLLGTRVPGRYDPMNSGLGYAYVNQRWVPVRSERYAYFSTLTERAVRFASEALRLTGRKRGEKVQINAQSLARFLSTSEGEESIARQKRNDAEAAQHRAKNQTPHQPEPVALVEPVRGAVVVQMADHVANKASAHARQARRERRPLGEL